MRHPNIVKECVNSIYTGTFNVSYEIIIISPEPISYHPPLPLRMLLDDGKSKYKAIEQGVTIASGKYILSLADYHSCDPGCIENLLKFMKLHDNELFVASSLLKDLNGVTRDICYELGIYYAACPCIKKENLKYINDNFMNPIYIDYWGDIDLTFRVIKAGGKIGICPNSFITIRNDIKDQLPGKWDLWQTDHDTFMKRWSGENLSHNNYTIEDLKNVN